jgi:lysophospholipase L1-like esterase
VVGWSNSPENALSASTNAGGSETTYRFFFYPTVSGTMERVHFSNYFGTTPITIGAARLAIATTVPAIDPTHDAPLTFSGSTSVTIPAGGTVISDPVNITFTFGQKMGVTMYLSGTYGALTHHSSLVITNYTTASGAGNTTTDTAGTSLTNEVAEWYLLSEMDVYGPYQGTVALLGSSPFDGYHSDYGNQNSYPTANNSISGQDNDRVTDWLARELNAAGYQIGVANAGVLADSAGTGDPTVPEGVTPGQGRIGRDVLSLPSVKTVVISLGSVDLRGTSCQDATEVESGLTSMVSQAQAAGVRVILATVSPSSPCEISGVANSGPYFTAANPWAGDSNPGPENPDETQRHIVNNWIRTTGAQLPGVVGIADFDAAFSYVGVHPDFMIPNLNSGDNFHPNGPGYQVMADSIPINLLLPQ